MVLLDWIVLGLFVLALVGIIFWTLRKKDKDIPILFLSAKSLSEDKIKGLKIGADDYITKPFSIEELLLKIKIFLKRSLVSTPETEKKQFENAFNYA